MVQSRRWSVFIFFPGKKKKKTHKMKQMRKIIIKETISILLFMNIIYIFAEILRKGAVSQRPRWNRRDNWRDMWNNTCKGMIAFFQHFIVFHLHEIIFFILFFICLNFLFLPLPQGLPKTHQLYGCLVWLAPQKWIFFSLSGEVFDMVDQFFRSVFLW